MAYQPKSYRKFVAGTVTAAVVASAVAPVASAATPSFSDVPAGHQFEEAINALAAQGTFIGKDGKFDMYGELTRRQAAVVFARLIEGEGKMEQVFSDVPTTDAELTKAAYEVNAAGVMTGANGKLNPYAKLTRQQMAKIIVEHFDLKHVEGSTVEIKDLDKAHESQREYIQILAENGITVVADGNFRPTETVKRGQFAAFVYRAQQAVIGELAIESVSALTEDGRYLEVKFNKSISELDKSQIQIKNTKTLERVGIEAVELGHDGKTATITLFEKDTTSGAKDEIARLTDYTVTVNAGSEVAEFTFQRPGFAEGRITDVDVEDRKFVVGGVTINVPKETEFDFQASLGADTRVWYDKDRDLQKVTFDDKEVVTGSLEVTKTRTGSENGKIEIDGKEYKLADTLSFYNNDSSTTIGVDGAEYDYAKVFFNDNGEVEFIVSYDWDNFFVVEKMDGEVAIAADDDELDLEDYILFKDGKTIKASDLKKGDVVYYDSSSNGGDGVAEVYNNSVSGEIETVYFDKIKIDGKNYDFLANEFGTAKYLDGDEFKTLDADKAEEFQAGGKVTAYLDRYGNVVYLEGTEGDVDKDTLSAYNVENILAYLDNNLADRGTLELELKNEKGASVLKSFRVSTLDKITVTNNTVSPKVNLEYEVDENYPGTTTEIEEFRLVANGGGFDLIAVDSTFTKIGATIKTLTSTNTNDLIIDYTVNSSDQVKELEFFTPAALTTKLELDDSYVTTTGGTKYRLQSDTVVYNASEGFTDKDNDGVIDSGEFDPDADDITITTWGELSKAGFDILAADVYADKDGNVDYLVIKQDDASDKTDFNAVITSILKNADGKVVEIKALVEGQEKTYKVDKLSRSISKGDSVVLAVNDSSELVEDIKVAPAELVTGKVTAVDPSEKTVTVGGTIYKLVSGGDVYDGTDTSDITEEQLRDIKVGYNVDILLEEAGTTFAEVITIKSNDNTAPTITNAVYSGSKITLTLSEAIDDSASDFTAGKYTLAGSAVAAQTVASVATGATADDNVIELTLSAPLAASGNVTVTVAANTLVDLSANVAGSLSATDADVAN
ncbi:S-layer homology domain-containing protein [Priestia abyssalis]|uniref:S-layer homology domain-containing protein n=1 Tax=Priestia abyssalis TaxID=1221450 RepID=UPI0009951A87|nr:S-layer homology domain-containing protein [Priestia abyssalis]